MSGILAGDTLQKMNGRDYSAQGTLGCVGCGAVLQSGPGFSFKDGSLGGQMQTGPGRETQDGSLGAVHQGASGIWGADGRFHPEQWRSRGGRVTSVNDPTNPSTWTVQPGPSPAQRGARGSARARAAARGRARAAASRAAKSRTAARYAARYARPRVRSFSGLGLINLSSELLIGLAAGAGIGWLVLRKR